MAYIVRMPKLGVEMEQGVVLEWHVDEGESVAEDELVAEIESEKTQAEVTAREAGVLRRILLAADEEGEPGAAMGIVGDPDEDISDLLAEAGAEPDAGNDGGGAATAADETAAAADASASADDPAPAAVAAGDADGGAGGGESASGGTGAGGGAAAAAAAPAAGDSADVKASPRARKRAAELGVDVAGVEGTGPRDSVIEADVERAAESGGAAAGGGTAAASAAETTTAAGSTAETAASGTSADANDLDRSRTVVERREQSRMRSTIARRLSESWREAPHVTVDRRVNAEPLFAAVEAAEASGHDVSMTDVLLRAVSETLSAHPDFNATFEDDVHTIYEEQNVGVAVDVDQGLITPVIPDVGGKTVDEISAVRGALTERALSGEYTGDDLSGGTFTVSNLGVFGVDSFTPIINPPEVAILGVNGIEEEPVRGERGGIAWQRTIGFSLSFDHRVVDGADAARFLATLADTLEDAVALVP